MTKLKEPEFCSVPKVQLIGNEAHHSANSRLLSQKVREKEHIQVLM
jgi:hypothetical protein